jgi:hypothetical protein
MHIVFCSSGTYTRAYLHQVSAVNAYIIDAKLKHSNTASTPVYDNTDTNDINALQTRTKLRCVSLTLVPWVLNASRLYARRVCIVCLITQQLLRTDHLSVYAICVCDMCTCSDLNNGDSAGIDTAGSSNSQIESHRLSGTAHNRNRWTSMFNRHQVYYSHKI